jgi:DNA-binding transcriptional MerR regulator
MHLTKRLSGDFPNRYTPEKKLMNIKEFSKISGISSYTLRYYEKIGIFQEIRRNASGHRDFTEKDLLWAEFINRLKETGMPLEQIKEYALLRQQGESTANARKNLLEDHASVLKNKISEEKKHLSKIKEKIQYYEKVILDKKTT